jgi:hypothetical protein
MPGRPEQPRDSRKFNAEWFAPLTVLQEDITETDFSALIDGSIRTLVYWDAHGIDVADAVFGRLIPALPNQNKIVIDDIWAAPEQYGLRADYQAGPLWSLFDELLPLWEYLSQRQIEFDLGNRWISFSAPARDDVDAHERSRGERLQG